MTLRFTILGCGSSGGVPRLGGHWGACDASNPKNRRRRCSMLVERDGPDGTTRVLIDTSPDFRSQMLDAGIGTLDAVIYTHAHADHTHGLDDLRMVVFNTRERLQVWADAPTRKDLEQRFHYAFNRPEGSTYPPILEMNEIDGLVTVTGTGGDITFDPFLVHHGAIDALGFRMENTVYLPDVAEIPEASWAKLIDLDMWVVDALRYTPHPTHAHLERTLEWIKRAAPKQAIVTNMHIDLDYATLAAELPENVTPAYDMLSFTI